jgi:hypothetical protein
MVCVGRALANSLRDQNTVVMNIAESAVKIGGEALRASRITVVNGTYPFWTAILFESAKGFMMARRRFWYSHPAWLTGAGGNYVCESPNGKLRQ